MEPLLSECRHVILIILPVDIVNFRLTYQYYGLSEYAYVCAFPKICF